jgi:type II secretory pathway pseudopilin PulG
LPIFDFRFSIFVREARDAGIQGSLNRIWWLMFRTEIRNRRSKVLEGMVMARRKGLTLVEMLVAMALIIFMMAILSEAFVKGLEAFRMLKAVGDMDQELRTVATALRRDLQADHFEGHRRLSTLTPDGRPIPPQAANVNALGPFQLVPPDLGFFSYAEGVNPPAIPEEKDAIDRPSMRDTNDSLHFTVRLAGNRAEGFFYGRTTAGGRFDNGGLPASRYDSAGNGVYTSQWAEVVYFLQPDPQGLTTGTLPLFHLYRRQLLLVPEFYVTGNSYSPPTGTRDAEDVTPITAANLQTFVQDNDLSYFQTSATTFLPNSPASVQFRERRFGGFAGTYATLQAQAPSRAGADLLLTNVISFDVKVWDPVAFDFMDVGTGGGAFGATNNAALGNVYDTWSQRCNGTWNYADPAAYPRPFLFPVRAVQIKIRIWDARTQQAREMTIVQDM